MGTSQKLNELLERANLEEEVELIGKGIGGNKVYDLYLRMQNDVIAHSPGHRFLFISASMMSGTNKVMVQGTDADKFKGFYQAIIDTLQAHSIDLVLVTPGVIGEKTDYSNSLDGDLNEYTKIIKSLAAENGTELIDLRGAMIEYNRKNNPDNMDKGVLTRDRVHLNTKGNTFVANIFYEMLKTKL